MLNLRLAAPADRDPVLRLVAALLVELGGAPPAPNAMSPTFDRLTSGGDDGFIALAENETQAIAVCTASYVQSLRTAGRYAVFQEMYVDPAHRSSGAGMALLRFALDHAAAAGCQCVELGAPRDGARAIAFYRRAGFDQVGARMRWLPGP